MSKALILMKFILIFFVIKIKNQHYLNMQTKEEE